MTEQLQSQARQIRTDILKMLYACQSGHPGGSLSLVEILLALYNNVLRYDPQNPSWPGARPAGAQQGAWLPCVVCDAC